MSLLLIVWVVGFGYLAYRMATIELYVSMVVCIIGLFAGVFIFLQRPDEQIEDVEEKAILEGTYKS